jgi:hypothetical protein
MSMKTYKITLECCDLVTLEVEAVNEIEAIRLAKNEARGRVSGDTFEVYEIDIVIPDTK